MMGALGAFGIDSAGLDTAVKLLVLALVVMWAALVYYTFADARRRIDDGMLVACAAAASFLFPFAGTIVYMIVRPPEYLADVRERELEMQAAQARLHEVGYLLCPHCEAHVEKDFLRCPACMRRLKDPCTDCARPLDPEWRLCPYCEAEVPERLSTPRRRRRRTPSEMSEAELTEAPPAP